MSLNPLMVRYVVNDVDAAIEFYTHHLGFRLADQSGPHFAILARENLQLVLSPSGNLVELFEPAPESGT